MQSQWTRCPSSYTRTTPTSWARNYATNLRKSFPGNSLRCSFKDSPYFQGSFQKRRLFVYGSLQKTSVFRFSMEKSSRNSEVWNPDNSGYQCFTTLVSVTWHDSCTCVTWLMHMCDVTHSHVWHDSSTCVTWLIHMCDMTHSHVWHDSLSCVTWLIVMCEMTHSHVWHDSFTFVTWLIHMCDMTHSHVWHDSLSCVTWLMHMCDMTHPHVWVTWLIHMCDMTHCHVWHDSFTCVTWLIHMCDMTHPHVWHDSWCEALILQGERLRLVVYFSNNCLLNQGFTTWVMSHMWMSHVTHVNESCRTCEWVMSHMWMSHVAHVNESLFFNNCLDWD